MSSAWRRSSRLLEVNNSFQLDVRLSQADVWRPIVIAVGQEEHFLERRGAAAIDDGETVQEYLTWDRTIPRRSMHRCAGRARTRARSAK
jgi:uncharacterized alpha-E superfamily protein